MPTDRSVQSVMDKGDQTPERSVDYYYLEAMRSLYLTDRQSESSDEFRCRVCSDDEGDDKDISSSADTTLSSNEDTMSRGRSWSHSRVDELEVGDIGQLPEFKIPGGRLKTRRHSDGVLLKLPMKPLENSHVRWADDNHKELERYRPRKKYSKAPILKPCPIKSILKNCSNESLTCKYKYEDRSSSGDEGSGGFPAA